MPNHLKQITQANVEKMTYQSIHIPPVSNVSVRKIHIPSQCVVKVEKKRDMKHKQFISLILVLSSSIRLPVDTPMFTELQYCKAWKNSKGWRSSSPSLLKQVCLEQFAQEHIQDGFESLQSPVFLLCPADPGTEKYVWT